MTWHYGLIARYWAEFNVAETDELDYYRGAIERFGQPALDLACGTGRLLLPLLADGLDVDGADISADMLALCAEHATRDGLAPRLYEQAMHELTLPRRYRTIFVCDSFGIGGRREHDLEALRRAAAHLEPGGALVFSQELAYDARWLTGDHSGVHPDWPSNGRRQRAAGGEEYELSVRLADFDPLGQRHTLQIRARCWRDDELVGEEERALDESLYFVPEILLMLHAAGLTDVEVQGRYTGLPATSDDATVVFVARRPLTAT